MTEAITTASGLQYVDEVVGAGESPASGQTVTVHYTGHLRAAGSSTARTTAAIPSASRSASAR